MTRGPLQHYQVLIGERDLSPWLIRLQINRSAAIGATATVEFDLEVAREIPIDYLGNVVVKSVLDSSVSPEFFGKIRLAVPDRGILSLHCQASIGLVDGMTSTFIHERVSYPEVIWSIGRIAGYAERALNIQGMEGLLDEDVEVCVPLLGLDFALIEGTNGRDEIQVGQWTLRRKPPPALIDDWPSDGVAWVGVPEEVVQNFQRGASYVCSRHRSSRMFDAELLGLLDAKFVASWLAARHRYTTAVLPNGQIQGFNRSTITSNPRLGGMVGVHAAYSGRRWIRWCMPVERRFETGLLQGDDGHLQPPIRKDMLASDREAIHAYARALNLSDPLSVVVALWDSIEFYVGKTRSQQLFGGSEIKRLRCETPAWLSGHRRERYYQLLSHLNSAPLQARMRVAVDRDGVPISEDEFKLLSQLRTARNKAQHGREIAMPSRDELERACSIVAKMIVYRVASYDRVCD